MRDVISSIGFVVRPVYIAVLCAIILRAGVQAYSVPSESMSPALRAGDHVLVTPLLREPRRGDVVILRHPNAPQQLLVKRIVATPGDHVEIRDGVLRLNGVTAAEPFVTHRSKESERPEIIPAGTFFVLGDRRSDSIDSRDFGFVPRELILGRARMVFWSSGADAPYPTVAAQVSETPASEPARGVNWSRIFRIVR